MKKKQKIEKDYYQKLKRTMWKNYKVMLSTSLPMILALLVIFLIALTPGNKEIGWLAFPFFLAGWTGVIMMVRKEAPSIIAPQRGKIAVIQGALITFLFWGGALAMLLTLLGVF